jgi:uncharacterized protein (DUF305 family)
MVPMKLLFPIVAAIFAVTLATPAMTQQSPTGQGRSSAGNQGMQHGSMTPAQMEYHTVMEKMNREMMEGMMDPDPGKSWLKQMIAHHQGAVEMSDIVLKHSKDQDILKEARKTKQQNQKDIGELQAELRK